MTVTVIPKGLRGWDAVKWVPQPKTQAILTAMGREGPVSA
jgi:hypothetical protein